METLIVHIKEKRDIKAVKSFLSTIKSAKVIEQDIVSSLVDNLLLNNNLEKSENNIKDLANFEDGTYKTGDKPSDFVSHKTPISEDEAEKQYQELRKKVWKLR